MTIISIVISIWCIILIKTCETSDSKAIAYLQPQQIHLSLGSTKSEMIITWVTFNITDSIVKYGINSMNTSTNGSVTQFTDGGLEKRILFVHRVVLTALQPGVKYQYHCGSREGWSAVYMFKTLTEGIDWSPKIAIYGDLGNVLAESLGPLQEEAQQGVYDMIMHLGDFAYDLHDDNARVGDEFFRQIEPMAAYVPYQACPGNHEHYYNFSNYDNRFSLISEGDSVSNNHYWSYNIGSAHIISFSTEFYYYSKYKIETGHDQLRYHYNWLEKDLTEANKPENRDKHPWIITMGHRPPYSLHDTDETIRLGVVSNGSRLYGLEDLFYKHGVDIEFWAHEHIYARLWPIYNNTVFNGTESDPYTNPKAPVHIISGSAGCYMKEREITSDKPYVAMINADYGYSVMTIVNKTHVNIKQISDDKKGEVVDEINVIKEVHGPQAWV